MFSVVALTAQGVNFPSREKEAALGAALAEELRGQTTPLGSTVASEYVERLGRKLAALLPDTGVSYTFAVIKGGPAGSTHEPLSLPGGYIFVPASLILAARDEAELAGMLAHSMAHIAARHGTRIATRGQLVNVTTGPFGGPEHAIPLRFLPFQRMFELEADREAVLTLARAGYDPAALVRYIERIQPELSATKESFSPLPSRAMRIAALEQAVRDLLPSAFSSSDDFQLIQEETRRLAITSPPSSRRSLFRDTP